MISRVRNVVSRDDKYYISRNRYLELRYFCLQYNEWKLKSGKPLLSSGSVIKIGGSGSEFIDKTGNMAAEMGDANCYISLILKAAEKADKSLSKYLFIGVTQGLSFETMKTLYDIPCEKEIYIDRYRKFFWVLDKLR